MQPKNRNSQEWTGRKTSSIGNAPRESELCGSPTGASPAGQPPSGCCATLGSRAGTCPAVAAQVVTNSRVTTKDFLVRNARFISMRQ